MGSGDTIAIAPLAESLFFGGVPDDILVNILCRLDEDPRDLARLVGVSTRFCKLIKTVCWKFRCEKTFPLLVAELLQSPSPTLHSSSCPEPPGGWASLQKLLVCCPGLWHAGVLLENWDFGLDREIGWFDDFGQRDGPSHSDGLIAPENAISEPVSSSTSEFLGKKGCDKISEFVALTSTPSAVEWSPNDDRISELVVLTSTPSAVECSPNDAGAHVSCDVCELDSTDLCTHHSEAGRNSHRLEKSVIEVMNRTAEECYVRDHAFQKSTVDKDGVMVALKQGAPQICKSTCMQSHSKLLNGDALNLVSLEAGLRHQNEEESDLLDTHVNQALLASSCATSHEKRRRERKLNPHKRQRKHQWGRCHVTTRPWNLSREQGNKLLANRFRADSLYICDWPGCLHAGDKRMYKLFRGVFKNFKHSHVWRNLKDMQAKATNIGCAFCVCKSTWDMVTTFCLKRSIEYHDDGEPVVRAYVCENGHVAGAWTDRPMYTL